LDGGLWGAWRIALDRMQVEWWKSVFGVTDPAAGWRAILVEAGETDRLSTKVAMRAIGLANRLSVLPAEEGPRKLFDAAWDAAGQDSEAADDLVGPPTWVHRVHGEMRRIGLRLAREERASAPPAGRAARRAWLQRYTHKYAWPRMRATEASDWGERSTVDPDYARFGRWSGSEVGLAVVWGALTAGDPVRASKAWSGFQAWVQLRILGAFNCSRFGGATLPCALCSQRRGKPGPQETAAHLLKDCPAAGPQTAETLRRWGRAEVVDGVLGGSGTPEDVERAVTLVGQLAARVRRARPDAAAVVEDAEFQEWLEAMGIFSMVPDMGGST